MPKAIWIALSMITVAACGDPEGCEVAGRVFPVGVTWTCGDGCNFCSCMTGPNGEITISSTLKACGGPPGPAANMLVCWDEGAHLHGESWPCGENECKCNDGKIERSH